MEGTRPALVSVKASLLCRLAYQSDDYDSSTWPVPGSQFHPLDGMRSVERGLDLMQQADEIGFDWVSMAEHHYSGFTLTPNPIVAAAAASQRVKRARIAVLGPIVPIQNPVRIAEEVAMLDNISGGRAVVGLVRGTPNELQTYGSDPAESRERFDEGLELILKAWTEPEPFSWSGKYYQFPTVCVWPRPVQQPRPPLMLSGMSKESVELAAKHKTAIGFFAATLEQCVENVALFRERAAFYGWNPTEDDIIYRSGGAIADTDEEALEVAAGFGRGITGARPQVAPAPPASEATKKRMAELEPPKLFDTVRFAGTPETVLNQIRFVSEAIGAGVVDINFTNNRTPYDQLLHSVELFGKKVLPHLKDF
jgi:alkanesulfonate monooxygenase SsuD/methylene tetrahydromethanopterin reductase-like flavin-dependent oxidoreductase (luciferase family)